MAESLVDLKNSLEELAQRAHNYEMSIQKTVKVDLTCKATILSKKKEILQHGTRVIEKVQTFVKETIRELEMEEVKFLLQSQSNRQNLVQEMSRLTNYITNVQTSLDRGIVTNPAVDDKYNYEALLQDLQTTRDISELKVDLHFVDVDKLTRECLLGSVDISSCDDGAVADITTSVSAMAPSLASNLEVRKLHEFQILFKPRGVACMADDSIVVCENVDNKVSVFGPDGSLRHDLQPPRRIAATDVDCAATNIVVADLTTKSVLVFEEDGSYIRSFPVGFTGCAGISVHDDKIFITSGNENKIYQLDWPSGGNKKVFARGPEVDLQRPRYVAASATNVVVSSFNNATVHVLDRSGQVQVMCKGQGSKPGHLGSPRGVAIDQEGRVIISDYDNNCIRILSREGQFLGHIDLQQDGPVGVAVNSQGHLVIAIINSQKVITYEYSCQ